MAELGVGEGGLPNGARQFSNLIKVQKDWIALGKTVKDKRADLTADEWKNVALFLRKVYQASPVYVGFVLQASLALVFACFGFVYFVSCLFYCLLA